MSTLVDAGKLRTSDIFELQNGSAYMVANQEGPGGTPRARLWCAHAPDAKAFDPSLIDLPPGQAVRVLNGDEAEAHHTHEGYVAHVFQSEMDRRHNTMMVGVYEQSNREDAVHRQQLRAGRPWWKKLFG